MHTTLCGSFLSILKWVVVGVFALAKITQLIYLMEPYTASNLRYYDSDDMPVSNATDIKFDFAFRLSKVESIPEKGR